MSRLQNRDHRLNIAAVGTAIPFEGQTSGPLSEILVDPVDLLTQEHPQAARRDLFAGEASGRLERGHHILRGLQPRLGGVAHPVDKARDDQLGLLRGACARAGIQFR